MINFRSDGSFTPFDKIISNFKQNEFSLPRLVSDFNFPPLELYLLWNYYYFL